MCGIMVSFSIFLNRQNNNSSDDIFLLEGWLKAFIVSVSKKERKELGKNVFKKCKVSLPLEK